MNDRPPFWLAVMLLLMIVLFLFGLVWLTIYVQQSWGLVNVQ